MRPLVLEYVCKYKYIYYIDWFLYLTKGPQTAKTIHDVLHNIKDQKAKIATKNPWHNTCESHNLKRYARARARTHAHSHTHTHTDTHSYNLFDTGVRIFLCLYRSQRRWAFPEGGTYSSHICLCLVLRLKIHKAILTLAHIYSRCGKGQAVPAHAKKSHMEKRWYSSNLSEPRHYTTVSNRLHVCADLFPGRDPPIPIEYKAGCAQISRPSTYRTIFLQFSI